MPSMKILLISNLYPPLFLGGYEIRCAQVAETLKQRGHDVRVLTSVYGLPVRVGNRFQRITEYAAGIRIDRWLHNYAFGPQQPYRPWVWFQAHRELEDARRLNAVLSEFKPEVVNCWNLNGISKLLLPVIEGRRIPLVHWIEDSWMIDDYGRHGEKAAPFWHTLWDGNWGPKLMRPMNRLVGEFWERRAVQEGFPTRALSTRPTLVSFVSEYLRTIYREAGLSFETSSVQFGGVPRARFFSPIGERPAVRGRLKILYAGQITADRGVHTLVEALGRLNPAIRSAVDTTVVGTATGVHHEYYRQVVARTEELGLKKSVTFAGKVGHNEMARLYATHDVLIFTSMRGEGLPLVMAEAMVAGCAVVTTGSGGAQELADLAQLPLFAKGDSKALALLLDRMINHPELVREIALRGQEIALQHLTLEGMIERWERTLLSCSLQTA